MKRIVLPFLVLFSSLSWAAQDLPTPSSELEIDRTNQPAKDWALGVSADFGFSWGFTVTKKINNQWSLESKLKTQGRLTNIGDNPTSEVPYGYEVDDFRRNKLMVMAVRNWQINDAGTMFLFAGAGIGYSDMSARVQFYNPWWIGYDKASPAGADTIRKAEFFIPATVGIRREDHKLFSRPAFVSLCFGFQGADSKPVFTAPNGRAVPGHNQSFGDSAVALEGGVWF